MNVEISTKCINTSTKVADKDRTMLWFNTTSLIIPNKTNGIWIISYEPFPMNHKYTNYKSCIQNETY